MIKKLVLNGQWERVAALAPPKPRRHRFPGRDRSMTLLVAAFGAANTVVVLCRT